MSDPTTTRLTQQAAAELSARAGVAPDAVQVVSVEEVEWRDSSLGLPQPGMMYAQVITPGYRIVLEAQGRRYRYHADMQRVLFAGEQ